MLKVKNLSHNYGDFAALRKLSFEVGEGEVVGLLGPNGAGKTTLIRALTGYFEASEGDIEVDGHDVRKDPVSVQSLLGYLPESTPLYPEMLVQEYLMMAAEIRGLEGEAAIDAIADAVRATELVDRLTTPIGNLSKGLRQRVGIAQAIMHKPRLLILDEPTSGLDPTQVVQVRELIRDLSKHATVLFSTHILSEVEALCDRVLIIHGGELKVDASLQSLQGSEGVVLEFAGNESSAQTLAGDTVDLPQVRERFEALEEVKGCIVQEGTHGPRLVLRTDGDDVSGIYRTVHESGLSLVGLQRSEASLEKVFQESALAEAVAPASAGEVRA